MSTLVISWVIIAILLVLVGIVLILASIKAHLAKPWKIVLGCIGILTLGAGLCWLFFW